MGVSSFCPALSLISLPWRMTGTLKFAGTGLTSPLSLSCLTIVHEPSLGSRTLPRPATAKTMSEPLAPNELLASKRFKRIFWPAPARSISQSIGPPIEPA